MKANELMVGDLVRVAKNVCIPKGTVVTIRGIDMDNSFEEMNLRGCVTCLPINDRYRMTGGVWVKYLEPIPLTPEILEKIGFKTQQNIGYIIDDWNGTQIIYDRWNYNLRIIKDYKTCLDIETFNDTTVHELQHALKLCGIEKEIEL